MKTVENGQFDYGQLNNSVFIVANLMKNNTSIHVMNPPYTAVGSFGEHREHGVLVSVAFVHTPTHKYNRELLA